MRGAVGRKGPGRDSPWVLVVETEGNLIDSVGVGHDQVEAVLQQGERTEGRKTLMVGKAAPCWISLTMGLLQAAALPALLVWHMRQDGQSIVASAAPLPDSS